MPQRPGWLCSNERAFTEEGRRRRRGTEKDHTAVNAQAQIPDWAPPSFHLGFQMGVLACRRGSVQTELGWWL